MSRKRISKSLMDRDTRSRERDGGDGGVRFAWLKDRLGDRARGGKAERRRGEANESVELTVERTGQDRERETD